MSEISSENQPEGNPQRSIAILDDAECEPCEAIKKALKEEIASGKVRVLQVTSDEALELLERAGAPDQVPFPSALVEDEKGVRLCEIYHSDDITLSRCGDEIIAIREPVDETQPPTD